MQERVRCQHVLAAAYGVPNEPQPLKPKRAHSQMGPLSPATTYRFTRAKTTQQAVHQQGWQLVAKPLLQLQAPLAFLRARLTQSLHTTKVTRSLLGIPNLWELRVWGGQVMRWEGKAAAWLANVSYR
eukprot:95504-Chlamydomonas_euryale.AAC.2